MVSEVPSLPYTLSALMRALGKIKLVAPGDTVISSIILPNAPEDGKFKNVKVVSAVTVRVW